MLLYDRVRTLWSFTDLLRRKAALFLRQLLVVVLLIVQVLRRAKERSLLWRLIHANHRSCPFTYTVCNKLTSTTENKLKKRRRKEKKITSKDGFTVTKEQHVAMATGRIEEKTARLHLYKPAFSFFHCIYICKYMCAQFVSELFPATNYSSVKRQRHENFVILETSKCLFLLHTENFCVLICLRLKDHKLVAKETSSPQQPCWSLQWTNTRSHHTTFTLIFTHWKKSKSF